MTSSKGFSVILFALAAFVIQLGASAGRAQLSQEGFSTPSRERSRKTLRHLQTRQTLQEESETARDRVIENAREEDDGPSAEGQSSFLLEGVRFSPSAILASDVLDRVTRPYIGTRVTLTDLYQIVDEVNALYREAKAAAARAVLPPQDIENGVLFIRLVEGRWGEVTVTGRNSTREAFIRRRIAAPRGGLVDLVRLEHDILLFNAVHDTRLKAVLQPGSEPSTTDLQLDVSEPREYELSLFVDNSGQKAIGRERVGITVSRNSLFGIRDDLTIGGVFADGTTAFHLDYNLPLNTAGTRLGLSYDQSDVSIREGLLRELNIEGDSRTAGLVLSHPLRVKQNGKWFGFLGLDVKSATTTVSELDVLDTELNNLYLGTDYRRFDASGYWYLNTVLTAGIPHFGGDREFLKINLETSRVQRLPGHIRLYLRGGLQFSDKSFLPGTEQFQIGGMTTVRGYREGLLSGDNAVVLNAELHYPVRFNHNGRDIFRDKLSGFLFLDHGATVADEDGPEDHYLTGAGAGLNLQIDPGLTGRFVLGAPVDDDLSGDEKDVRFHFFLQYSF